MKRVAELVVVVLRRWWVVLNSEFESEWVSEKRSKLEDVAEMKRKNT